MHCWQYQCRMSNAQVNLKFISNSRCRSSKRDTVHWKCSKVGCPSAINTSSDLITSYGNLHHHERDDAKISVNAFLVMNDSNFNTVNVLNVELLPHAIKWTMKRLNTFFTLFIELDYTIISDFYIRTIGRKEMFYLMMHSTHFIYGYMVSDLW